MVTKEDVDKAEAAAEAVEADAALAAVEANAALAAATDAALAAYAAYAKAKGKAETAVDDAWDRYWELREEFEKSVKLPLDNYSRDAII